MSLFQLAKTVEPLGEVVRFTKGQVLFYEKHEPFGFFIIKKGKVSPANDFCPGLDDLLHTTPYTFTCIADSDVEAIFVPKIVLAQHLKKS